MIPTKKLADMYLCTDGLPIATSPLFRGYDSLETIEFQNRDPRMAMTFIVPGSTAFGEWVPADRSRFRGSSATRTGYMIRKFEDETVEATQFAGEYDSRSSGTARCC